MSLAILAATAFAAEPPTIDVEIHGLVHARTGVVTRENDSPLGIARIDRARIMVNPVIAGRIRGMLHLEMANGVNLLDARADAVVAPWIDLGVGLGIVPYSRAWNTPLPLVALGNRNAANNIFSPGRRAGGFVHLHGGPVHGWVGVYDATAPADLAGDEHAPMAAARIEVRSPDANPTSQVPSLRNTAPGATVGAGLAAESSEGEPLVRGTIDVAFHTGGFSAEADVFTRLRPATPARWGTSIQLGQFVVPQRLAVHGRLAVIGPDVIDEDVRLVPELALTGYVYGTHAYVQLLGRLGAPVAGTQETAEVVLRGQLAF